MEFDLNYNYIEVYINQPNTVITLSENRRGDVTVLDLTDWGDGAVNSELSHTYNTGTYIIKSKLSVNEIEYNDILNEHVKNYYMINNNMTDWSYLMAGFINIEKFECDSRIECQNVTTMKGMFKLCKSLKTLIMNGSLAKGVKDLSYFLYDCENIEKVNIHFLKESKPRYIQYMFSNTPLNFIDDINLWFMDTSWVINASHLFENCTNLVNFKEVVRYLNFMCCENIDYCFANTGISEICNLDVMNCEMIDSLEGLFKSCKNLVNADLTNFITFDINNMYETFADCPLLESVDMSTLRLNEIVNLNYTFNNDSLLKRLILNNKDFENVELIEYNNLFSGVQLNYVELFNCSENTINKIIELLPSLSELGVIKINRLTNNINENLANNKMWNISYIPYDKERRCLLLRNVNSGLLSLQENALNQYELSNHIHNEYENILNSLKQRIENISNRANMLSQTGGEKGE